VSSREKKGEHSIPRKGGLSARALLRVTSWPLGWQVLALAIGLSSWMGIKVWLGRRLWLLPGITSDGHHVIEDACDACHAGFEPPGNDACRNCHRDELADDTHPTATFDDPRWASDLLRIDARRCVSCHAEHARNQRTLSVRRELCFGCHDDVVERRDTHRDFAAGSCMDGGCHNYHDNRTLDVAFMRKRLGMAATHAHAPRLRREPGGQPAPPIAPAGAFADPAALEIRRGWLASAHARDGVDCVRCHSEGEGYDASPDERVCADCHAFEVDSFRHGKHGARRALGLPALRPAEARLPMRSDPENDAVGCAACHDAHALDTQRAAVEACLGCHDDEHSRNYPHSPHAAAGVTCATCHLPRIEVAREQGGLRVAVQHNNSLTLQPSDRMARMVCLDCHSLELSFAALFDVDVVRTNFARMPARSHSAIEMLQAAGAP